MGLNVSVRLVQAAQGCAIPHCPPNGEILWVQECPIAVSVALYIEVMCSVTEHEFFLKLFLEDTSPLCWATDTPVFDFW